MGLAGLCRYEMWGLCQQIVMALEILSLGEQHLGYTSWITKSYSRASGSPKGSLPGDAKPKMMTICSHSGALEAINHRKSKARPNNNNDVSIENILIGCSMGFMYTYWNRGKMKPQKKLPLRA